MLLTVEFLRYRWSIETPYAARIASLGTMKSVLVIFCSSYSLAVLLCNIVLCFTAVYLIFYIIIRNWILFRRSAIGGVFRTLVSLLTMLMPFIPSTIKNIYFYYEWIPTPMQRIKPFFRYNLAGIRCRDIIMCLMKQWISHNSMQKRRVPLKFKVLTKYNSNVHQQATPFSAVTQPRSSTSFHYFRSFQTCASGFSTPTCFILFAVIHR